jgi:hypothetical protein
VRLHYRSYSGSTTYNPGSITADTNIALADQPGEQAADKTLSVRLDTENLKAQLSLSRNNSNLNRRVWLKGTSNAKYFGQPGLESIKKQSGKNQQEDGPRTGPTSTVETYKPKTD